MVDLDFTDDNLVAAEFLRFVSHRNAKLVADIMMAGFVHGVLNTDNINISGELFDYGPYRFLPEYNPNFTAAYFDSQGLYSYGRQPYSFLWNLHQLGLSLQKAYPELPFEEILSDFGDQFNFALQQKFLDRLNLKSDQLELIGETISLLFQLMDEKTLLFEQTLFDFHSFDLARIKKSPQSHKYVGTLFDQLAKNFNRMTINDVSKKSHPYFKNEKPLTLLIEEIETIWSAIAENDDWSLFQNKLQSIRAFRGVFESSN
jgi:uncharacterized protein YdiU (UPF0061 family)